MDTMSAFIRGQIAREQGNKMSYFDGIKIKQIMKKHKVNSASIYLESDREWTETEIHLNKKGKLSAESIGVTGSYWATPMLEIGEESFEVGTRNKKRMTIKFIE